MTNKALSPEMCEWLREQDAKVESFEELAREGMSGYPAGADKDPNDE
jgi:hypothetical protein